MESLGKRVLFESFLGGRGSWLGPRFYPHVVLVFGSVVDQEFDGSQPDLSE